VTKTKLVKPESPDDLLTPGEISKLFNVDPKTVTRWAKTGKLPPAIRTPGGHRRYRRSTITPFLNLPQHSGVPGSARGMTWKLYCDGVYMYSTADPAEADEWFEADPPHHEAREVHE